MRKILLAGVSAVALMFSGAAHADGQQYSKIGSWSIWQHPDGACSAKNHYDRGTSLFVSHDVTDDTWGIIIGNPNWTTLQEGKKYTLRLVIDGTDRWEGQFTASRSGDDGVLIYNDISQKFMLSLMQRWKVDIYDVNNKFVTGLPLSNSYAAVIELMRCEKDGAARPSTSSKGAREFSL